MRACLLAAFVFSATGAWASEETIERWLFLGRRTESGWQPPSVSLAAPAYPVKPGSKVMVKRHALLYGAVDCKVVDAAELKADDVAPAVELVRAGDEGLEITGTPIECPSVCGAKTVWVNVRIPAARLIRIDH